MITATEARALMEKSFREDAVKHAIKCIEDSIRERAIKGERHTTVTFNKFPGVYNDFIKKYGEERKAEYVLSVREDETGMSPGSKKRKQERCFYLPGLQCAKRYFLYADCDQRASDGKKISGNL